MQWFGSKSVCDWSKNQDQSFAPSRAHQLALDKPKSEICLATYALHYASLIWKVFLQIEDQDVRVKSSGQLNLNFSDFDLKIIELLSHRHAR